jgi:hypothetical protein
MCKKREELRNLGTCLYKWGKQMGKTERRLEVRNGLVDNMDRLNDNTLELENRTQDAK